MDGLRKLLEPFLLKGEQIESLPLTEFEAVQNFQQRYKESWDTSLRTFTQELHCHLGRILPLPQVLIALVTAYYFFDPCLLVTYYISVPFASVLQHPCGILEQGKMEEYKIQTIINGSRILCFYRSEKIWLSFQSFSVISFQREFSGAYLFPICAYYCQWVPPFDFKLSGRIVGGKQVIDQVVFSYMETGLQELTKLSLHTSYSLESFQNKCETLAIEKTDPNPIQEVHFKIFLMLREMIVNNIPTGDLGDIAPYEARLKEMILG